MRVSALEHLVPQEQAELGVKRVVLCHAFLREELLQTDVVTLLVLLVPHNDGLDGVS